MNLLFDQNEIRLELTPVKVSPVDELSSHTEDEGGSPADELDEEFTTIIQHNPTLAYARHNGSELNPVSCARVLCSPPPGLVSRRKLGEAAKSEQPTPSPLTPPPPSHQFIVPIWGLSDPRFPYFISLWVQVILNTIIAVATLYWVYKFVSMITTDVKHKRQQQIAQLFRQKVVCTRRYEENLCGTADMPRIIADQCDKWQQCMEHDPYHDIIGLSSTVARTLADIVNSFANPLSIKALIVMLIVVVGSIAVMNFTFSLFRRSLKPDLALIKSSN